MRYLIIHAERKYHSAYDSEETLLADHALAARDAGGFPILKGFGGPRWIIAGGRIEGEHLEYAAIRPDQPDTLNRAAWEA